MGSLGSVAACTTLNDKHESAKVTTFLRQQTHAVNNQLKEITEFTQNSYD